MQPISTSVPIGDRVRAVQKALEGLPFEDAFFSLTIIERPINVEELRSETERILKESPIHAITGTDIFDASGRKIDAIPSTFTEDKGQHESAIRGHMAKNASFHWGISAQASIATAMRQMIQEHDIDDTAVKVLIQDSAFIPGGRLPIFVRGIRLGLNGDWSTGLHLLVPQTENALRAILHAEGVITRSLDDVGIEEEWTLGTILAQPKTAELLGSGQVYELRTLMLNKPGSNFRNLITHGMIGDEELSGAEALYLWWLIFRLVAMVTSRFRAFTERNTQQVTQRGSDPASDGVQTFTDAPAEGDGIER